MMGEERHSIFVCRLLLDTTGGAARGPRGKPFHFSDSAGELTRHCRLESFDLSVCEPRRLVDFAVQMAPRTVILGHATRRPRLDETELRDRLPKLNIIQPALGEALEV